MDVQYNKLQSLDGSSLSAADFEGKITVISFTDQKSQAQSAKVGGAMGKKFMDHPRFQIFTAVKVPSMFKGLAGALLKSGQTKARESAYKKFEKEGKPVPEGLADRIRVVFDLDGKCSNECLPEWKDGQARLILVDEKGKIVAQNSDDDAEAAVEALAPEVQERLG